ncbi:hypothetical protein SAMN05428967_4248 [Phyllobacterium sp. YR620]|uniref:DUF6389 family protein n=1 Tax=Phyllobacterium sp. YR620 TaxID=1881066 RepID=UPI0008832F69|nr:DUF6389 family protein [Phyllobacterium sp. YR620]SDP90337.1 hypothetical protein SAMN05428967_4248 [Phyllobacterium sp. YR620]
MRLSKLTTEAHYKAALQNVLQAHTALALAKLEEIKRSIPAKVGRLEIGIHPGQDEDGFFGVMVHLDGPDLYVLNKAIEAHRSLFEVRYLDGRVQPDVLTCDPGEPSFSINDAIVDTCMDWVEDLWQQLGGVGLPALVYGEEGYGSKGNVTLLP